MCERSNSTNPDPQPQPEKKDPGGLSTAQLTAILGEKLNHPHFIVDGAPDASRFSIRQFVNLDPTKLVREVRSFKGLDTNLICEERLVNCDATSSDLTLRTVYRTYISGEPDDVETSLRTHKLTSEGLFLVDGPLGMAGLMYSNPQDGAQFIDLSGSLNKWRFVGDFIVPTTNTRYEGVFALESENHPNFPSFFAPGIGLVFDETENGIVTIRQIVEASLQ